MKTNTRGTVLSGIVAVSLLTAYGKAQPQTLQTQPAQAVQAAAAPAVRAEPSQSTATPVASAGQLAQFIAARSGNSMRLFGFADGIHGPWQVEGKIIQGRLDVGPTFPVEPGQAVMPGPVVAVADVYIPVTSLKSERDDSHYSDPLDDGMHERLKPEAQRRIHFHLTELVLKEAPKSRDQPYLFDSNGALAVAGVTNRLNMPVQVLPLGNGKLKISGKTVLQMSDFKIEPPVLISTLKTHNDVHLSFDWMVVSKGAPTATASGHRSPL